jgi:hypothetical protein
MTYIKGKTARDLLRRTLEASNDAQDIIRALRSIAALVDVFTVRPLAHRVEELRHSRGDADGRRTAHCNWHGGNPSGASCDQGHSGSMNEMSTVWQGVNKLANHGESGNFPLKASHH